MFLFLQSYDGKFLRYQILGLQSSCQMAMKNHVTATILATFGYFDPEYPSVCFLMQLKYGLLLG